MRSIPAWAGEPADVFPSVLSPKVYPRVGGGTLRCDLQNSDGLGLSPRGRGNLRHHAGSRLPLRSIPAWAGEPKPNPAVGRAFTVYPRVGGGTADKERSIPAWAGEPIAASGSSVASTVYPRVGGGTDSKATEGGKA